MHKSGYFLKLLIIKGTYHKYICSLTVLITGRVAETDQNGSAFILEAGSGSALKSKLRSFRGVNLSRGGPWTLNMEALGLQISPEGSIDQWSKIPSTLSIRIRIEVKIWIRIRIEVTWFGN
jgi:hypothetical protein